MKPRSYVLGWSLFTAGVLLGVLTSRCSADETFEIGPAAETRHIRIPSATDNRYEWVRVTRTDGRPITPPIDPPPDDPPVTPGDLSEFATRVRDEAKALNLAPNHYAVLGSTYSFIGSQVESGQLSGERGAQEAKQMIDLIAQSLGVRNDIKDFRQWLLDEWNRQPHVNAVRFYRDVGAGLTAAAGNLAGPTLTPRESARVVSGVLQIILSEEGAAFDPTILVRLLEAIQSRNLLQILMAVFEILTSLRPS